MTTLKCDVVFGQYNFLRSKQIIGSFSKIVAIDVVSCMSLCLTFLDKLCEKRLHCGKE